MGPSVLLCAALCTVFLAGTASSALPGEDTKSNITTTISRRELSSKPKPHHKPQHMHHVGRKLDGCGTGNPIDACWQCNPNWFQHRQKLADCAIGFGQGATGGRNGAIYVVTDSGNDNPTSPVPGTIRYAAIQDEPLWIIFDQDMTITLKEELIVTSYKTFDGRGQDVHIAYGACFTIQDVSNVIIHGLHIHHCKSTGPAIVRSSTSHVGHRGSTDGDAISVFNSRNLWFDHNYLASSNDGLIDVIEGSDAVTISNNYFTDHDKVMLLGAHDGDYRDTNMKVTVAFNHFGAQLIQRMPRCRLGTFHVVNNYYQGWGIYAIGGSASPTINSERNYYDAAGSPKEVTKQLGNGGNWRSLGDLFVDGAYFKPIGAATSSSLYNRAISFSAISASQVSQATAGAGPT